PGSSPGRRIRTQVRFFFECYYQSEASIVGADIYIASALTGGLVSPFSIVLWMVAGLFARAITMVFACCRYTSPVSAGRSHC
ncbi:MAG: hypothetical protein M0P33_10605, partial [Massilibacteroides sp.]|nr:hypothetical protein [Massilibacteroides sp.]